MQAILIDAGVSAEAIKIEDQSKSTYENLRNAAVILRAHGIRDITIVTNGYHGPRSKMVARSVGLRAALSTPDETNAHRPTHFRMVMREIPALPAYAVRLIWWRWRDRNL